MWLDLIDSPVSVFAFFLELFLLWVAENLLLVNFIFMFDDCWVKRLEGYEAILLILNGVD